jgi:4-amino-4-deoxy-L-arabinose transferase-like glycosyltransferase
MAERDPTRLAWAIALAFAALRVALIGRLQLAPDEAYYWEWSRSLDWSYYDQGPMLAWVIRAGTLLLGTNEWGVRLGSLLCGLGLSAVYIALAKRLGRPALAPWLVLAANSLLLFAVGGVLMMHDSLAASFWSLALVAACKALDGPGQEPWWLAAGFFGGAGVLSKYTGVLLFPCLLLACASHPRLRSHLKGPWFWAALGLGALLAGYPILRWNLQWGWPSLQHVASLGGGDASRLSPAALPEFLGSQFALVTPLLFALVLSAWHWAWQRRRDADPGAALRWFFFCCSAPVFGLFLLLSLRSRVEGNWPAPAYVAALPLVAWRLSETGRLGSRLSRWALGAALLFTFLVYSQGAWGWLPLPGPQAPRLDTTFRLQGWRELAAQVAQERASLGPSAFVGCRTYQNAAELAFYLPGHPRPLILQKGSINHQYRFWNRPQDFLGRDAVLVIGQDWELNEMREMFKSIEERPAHTAWRRGVAMRRSLLYVGRGFKGVP